MGEKATHTKGPWRVVPGSAGSFDILATPPGDDEGTLIAETYITDGEEANARLIAASPDLLAEHADAIGFLEGYAEDMTSDGFTRHAEKIDALIARMKATQTKATGTEG